MIKAIRVRTNDRFQGNSTSYELDGKFYNKMCRYNHLTRVLTIMLKLDDDIIDDVETALITSYEGELATIGRELNAEIYTGSDQVLSIRDVVDKNELFMVSPNDLVFESENVV